MLRRISRCLCVLLAAAVSAVLAGCGGGAPAGDRPEVVPVNGTVLYNGEPLEGANVMFIPQGGSQGAVGRTDSRGRFQLRTFEPDDGAVPGSYQVTVRKVEVIGDIEDDGEEDADAPPVEQRSLIPEHYGQADSSGLTATVEADGNEFTFELAD